MVNPCDREKEVWKLPNNQPSSGSDRPKDSRAGRVAVLLYGGTALVAALIFWAVTTFAGSYPAVARYGGAAWVFVLMMIVLMPLVIPRVRAWQKSRADRGARLESQPSPSERV